MKEPVKQSLSAMLDNESDEFEVRRTLGQLDDEGVATWSRFAVTSAMLRNEAVYRSDISAQVMAALEEEPVMMVKQERNGFFTKPLASVAIAASVTAAVIFGVQNFQADPTRNTALAANSGLVLPGPTPSNPDLLPAQYGSRTEMPMQSTATDADIIRLPVSMDQYIRQHQAMISEQPQQWAAGWVPKGYQPVSHQVRHNTEVMQYSNGHSVISIFVEPEDKQQPGVVQSGETVALGKPVGQQFVTVVGDVPLIVADRIAGAVRPGH